MRRIHLIALLVLAIAATVLPALYEGRRNFRWGADPALDRFIQRMNSFPDRIGDWRQVAELPLDEATRDQLQPFATISRTYSDGTHLAHVFVLLGPIGPTAVHTPDICFSSFDFKSLGNRMVVPASGARTHLGSQFWQIDFISKRLDAQALRNWYAWTLDGRWRASPNPRFEFADSRSLFKLQVAIAYPSVEAMKSDRVGPEFMEQFEQSLALYLFN